MAHRFGDNVSNFRAAENRIQTATVSDHREVESLNQHMPALFEGLWCDRVQDNPGAQALVQLLVQEVGGLLFVVCC